MNFRQLAGSGIAVVLALGLVACGDPSPKDQAQSALDSAYAKLVDANSGRYRANVPIGGQALRAEGTWDLKRELTDGELSLPSFGEEGAVDGKFAIRSRIIGTHVYGGPAFGPAERCWFDYGDADGEMFESAGVEDSTPWIHPSVVILREARALGFEDGNPSELSVEIWADAAFRVLFNKLFVAHEDELRDEQTWVTGRLTVQDGEFSTLKVPLEGVFDALEEGGAKFESEDEIAAITELGSKTLTIAFDRFGSRVEIEAPAKATLISVSAGMDVNDDVELCDAAGK